MCVIMQARRLRHWLKNNYITDCAGMIHQIMRIKNHPVAVKDTQPRGGYNIENY